MKRLLAILMAIVMLFSFAACTVSNDDGNGERKVYEFTTGYDETKYNAPGTLPIFKEKQTISVTTRDHANVENLETNALTLRLEEELNAEFIFQILPNKEYTTKINLMAAAGGDEFTDAIIGNFGDGMVMNLADAGVIVPITEYAYNKDIAPYMTSGIERLGWDYYPYITMPDGEIYYLPQVNDTILVNNSKMWVYKPWFEAAGINIDDIHTTEEFKNALLTVVKSDPNGNGKADEVGITSYSTSLKWIHYLMNAFIYAGGKDYMYVQDGKLDFAFQQEEWRDGLRYIKELYDLGLIDPLAFSQDAAGYKAMLNYDETIVTAWSKTDVADIAEEDPRRLQYETVPPLNSSWNDGKPLSSHSPSVPSCGMVISANAAEPEMVFRFGDYMTSEEISVHNRYGVKGVDWREPVEGDVALYAAFGYKPYLAELVSVWGVKQNSHWYQYGPLIRAKEDTAGCVSTGELNLISLGAQEQLGYQGSNPKEEVVKLIYTEDEDEIVSESLANIKSYANEACVKFIIGDLDLDKDWDAYLQQIETMGVAEVLECAQAAYDRLEAMVK